MKTFKVKKQTKNKDKSISKYRFNKRIEAEKVFDEELEEYKNEGILQEIGTKY